MIAADYDYCNLYKDKFLICTNVKVCVSQVDSVVVFHLVHVVNGMWRNEFKVHCTPFDTVMYFKVKKCTAVAIFNCYGHEDG